MVGFNKKYEDIYYLDENNRIAIYHDINNYKYDMIHERQSSSKYIPIKKWSINEYWFKVLDEVAHIKELHLFQVQNSNGGFDAWYDYINDYFIVPKGLFDKIEFGKDNKYLKEYNGAIGSFIIKSDFDNNDIFSYSSVIDGEEIIDAFEVKDGKYFAILNLDGTIRGNRLFKGESIHKIWESIDLTEYGSIESFKRRKKEICNNIKKERKERYFNNIKKNNNKDYSPYMDSEVLRVLKLKK